MLKPQSHRYACALLGAVLATAVAFVPETLHAQATTTAQARKATSKVFVQGPVSTAAGAAAGTFNGVLNVTNFVNQNGQLAAVGQLTGTITNLDGTTTAVNQAITPTLVTAASASCAILNLTLGPLHLNVLGLVIDLNQVNLNIVAQPGAGNLLGNLLCGVADLLNGGGPLSAIISDLNMILKNL
jgi:hypothetical protein